jgi:hypothetical protein
MMTFSPTIGMEGLEVEHINGNRADNSLENLRWIAPTPHKHVFLSRDEFIREYLELKDGGLVWKKAFCRNLRGQKAGTKKKSGYCTVTFRRKLISVHRIIYFLLHGVWSTPKTPIDHINGNPSDNRIENLRMVTQAQNANNTALRRSGRHVGAVFNKKTGKWSAVRPTQYAGKALGKRIHLGTFKTHDEAASAVRLAIAKALKDSP